MSRYSLSALCVAESKSGVKDDNNGSKGSTGEAGAVPKAPLADMEPAPDTTMPAPQPAAAMMDCSTWPGLAGRGSVSVPPSPTIKPSPTPSSSSSVSSMPDGRLSPTKGDSRADRFRLEQRKLLSAIKSDPKLGIAGEEEEEEEGERLEADTSADAASASLLQDGGRAEGKTSSQSEGAQRSSKPAELYPGAVVSGQQARGGTDVVAGVAIPDSKDGKRGVPQVQKSEASVGASEEKGEAKGRRAERSDSGSKLQASADAALARSGIRLGTGSSPRTDTPSLRSGALSAASKYSAVSTSKTRPAATSVGQRRSNITGLNGGSSSSSSTPPTTTSPSRSVLSRYPPASTTSSSASRRPVASHPPSSAASSRSSSGSLPGPPRRPASSSTGNPVRHSFESSLRTYSGSASTAPLASAASDNSLASAGSLVRGRRVSGDKGALQGRVGSSTPVTKANTTAGTRSAAGSSRLATASGGALSKTVSSTGSGAKTVASLPGTNGASRSPTSVSGAGVTAKLIPGATSVSGVGATTKGGGGAPGGVGASRRFQEKCQDQKSTEASGQPTSGAKDLSSDRTPRFV